MDRTKSTDVSLLLCGSSSEILIDVECSSSTEWTEELDVAEDWELLLSSESNVAGNLNKGAFKLGDCGGVE